jgi:hypothetical protein
MNTLYHWRKNFLWVGPFFLWFMFQPNSSLASDFLGLESTARSLMQRAVGPKGRTWLFEHLPGLFPVRIVCHWTPKGGKRVTILPGDSTPKSNEWVTLDCPSVFSMEISPGAQVRIESTKNDPAIQILEGVVQFTLQKGKFRIILPSNEWDANVRLEQTKVVVRVSSSGSDVLCQQGLWDLSSKRSSGLVTDRLGHLFCRGRIQMGKYSRYLSSGVWLSLVDFPTPIRAWPVRDINIFSSELGVSKDSLRGVFGLFIADNDPRSIRIWPPVNPELDRTCVIEKIDLARGEVTVLGEVKGKGPLSYSIPSGPSAYAALCTTSEGTKFLSDVLQVSK